MRFQCPFCRGIVAVDNTDLGIDVQCGHCGEIVTVPHSRVATGAVIADFIILQELGRGGMGVVYLAHQISLDRPAALKILSDKYINNAEFVAGFIREARAAAKLNHPHIVQAYAVGEDEGIFYFAMENIDGETLKNILKRNKKLPVDEAVMIIQQIAEALNYAWKEEHLVHCDIKPDNIMMTKNNRAKLADLGLSHVAGELDDDDSEEVMGTPQYISPEHLTGAPMDIRSDIYSLGATFYHLVTGKFPFTGKNGPEIARKHIEEDLVPPREVDPEIPEGVSQVICKMMAKNVKDRYQDGEELVDDLRIARKGKMPEQLEEDLKRAAKDTSRKRIIKNLTKKATGKSMAKSKTQIFTGLGVNLEGRDPDKLFNATDTMAPFQLAEIEKEKSKMLLVIIVAVIFIIAFIVVIGFYIFSPDQSYQPVIQPKKPLAMKAEKKTPPPAKPEKSEFESKVDNLLKLASGGETQKREFLRLADKFFASSPKPATDAEKNKLRELRKTFVTIDEKLRVVPARQAKRKTHEKQITARKKADATRRLAIRRKAEAEKRRKELAAKKAREEKARKEKLERQIARYKTYLEKNRDLMRGKYIFTAKHHGFTAAKQVFDPALEEPGKMKNSSPQEKKLAGEFTAWAKKMQSGIDTTAGIWKMISNSGAEMRGRQLEVKKGSLGKIISIKDGKITLKQLLSGKTETVAVSSLEPLFYVNLLKKAAQKAGNTDDYLIFLLNTGQFELLEAYAPDASWKNLASETAYQYFLYTLKNGSPGEKNKLQKKFGRTPEYLKASKAAKK